MALTLLTGGDDASVVPDTKDRLHLPASADSRVPWCGLRLLVAGLRATSAPGTVEAALRPRRASLGLIFDLPGEDSAADRQFRARIAPQLSGCMSHNGMVNRALFVDAHEVLVELLEGRALALARPSTWDRASLAMLVAAVREAPGASFLLQEQLPPVPARGPARAAVLGLHARMDRLRHGDDVTLDPRRLVPKQAARPVGPWDDATELRALERLESAQAGGAPLSRSDLGLLASAMRIAFQRGGFRCSHARATGLLENGSAEDELRRLAHRVAALSAYNLQVRTSSGDEDADRALARELDHHFRAALEGEVDPAWRAHLLYRLCINEGRRFSRVDAADGWGGNGSISIAGPDWFPQGPGHSNNIQARITIDDASPTHTAGSFSGTWEASDDRPEWDIEVEWDLASSDGSR